MTRTRRLIAGLGIFLITAGGAIAGSINTVSVKQSNGLTEIDNGLVKASFETTESGLEQKYFARKNNQWVLVVESFRPPTPFPENGNALFDSSIDKAHRLIVTESLRSVEIVDQSHSITEIKLTGAFRNASVEQTVRLNTDENFFHIEVAAALSGRSKNPAKLEYLLSTFTFNLDKGPSFVYTPVLKDRVDDILGDRDFLAPAVILQEENLFAAKFRFASPRSVIFFFMS